MTDLRRVESELEQWLDKTAGPRVPDYVDAIVERTARTRQRPGWLFIGRRYSGGDVGTLSGRQSLALVVLVGLLAAAVLGTVLVAGALQPRPLLRTTIDDTAVPTAIARSYRVAVPDGVTPESNPEEIERTLARSAHPALDLVAAPRRIEAMEWVAPGVERPDADGGATTSENPWWAVELVGSDDARVVVMLDDQTLEIFGSGAGRDPTATEVPFVPETPPPDPDPLEPVALTSSTGRTITPSVTVVPGAESRVVSVGPLVVSGDDVWATVSSLYEEDPAYLVHVDATTGAIRDVAVPGPAQTIPPRLAAAGGLLWVATRGQIYGLEPGTGEVARSFPNAEEGWVVGLDEHGLWLSRPSGITLLDPVTGAVLRRFETREGDRQAYRTIGSAPSFGSLWDVDRDTGTVLRMDPVTGDIQATIELGNEIDYEQCADDPGPRPGVPGFPDLVVAECAGLLTILIDASTNTVVGSVSGGGGIVIDGAWWQLGGPEASGPGWDDPGTLSRMDPRRNRSIEILTLTKPRTVGYSPVVAGGSLWFRVAEAAAPNQGHDHDQRLVEVPLDELAGEQ